MSLRHVDQTVNPSAAWKYLTKAVMLGRSYALYAASVACLVSLGILGRSESPRCRAIFQSRGPVNSLQPVSTAMPCFSLKVTALRVKVNAQSASHRGLTPIKVWRKPGMRCPLMGKSNRMCGKAKFPIPADCCVFPVSVPTVTLGAAQSMLTTGSPEENYMSVVPESTMSVALFKSARLRSLWVQLTVNLLMSGKGEGGDVMSRVGI